MEQGSPIGCFSWGWLAGYAQGDLRGEAVFLPVLPWTGGKQNRPTMLAAGGDAEASSTAAYCRRLHGWAVSIFVQLNTGTWAVSGSRYNTSTEDKIKAKTMGIIYSSQPKTGSLLVCIQAELI